MLGLMGNHGKSFGLYVELKCIRCTDMGHNAEIQALRLKFGPQGWYLSLWLVFWLEYLGHTAGICIFKGGSGLLGCDMSIGA